MNIRNGIIASLATLLAVAMLTGCQSTPQPKAEPIAKVTETAQQPAAGKLKGKIKTVVGKNNTISLTIEGKGLVVVKYNDATRLVNAASFKDLHPDELLNVEYRIVGAENVATVISKVVAELPKGASLIGLDEAHALVLLGPQAGSYTMFDSRPGSRYHEGHIPGAKSLPFAEMDKADKEGKLAALLPPEKDKLLVFYCGGIT